MDQRRPNRAVNGHTRKQAKKAETNVSINYAFVQRGHHLQPEEDWLNWS